MIQSIAELLKRTMGFDLHAVGSSTLRYAVRHRMNQCGISHLDEYWKRLQASKAELQELIEAVVVPETRFFRDREAFVTLQHYVAEEWLPAHLGGRLRVLSIPCSTGEEPYSIAMALLDAGISPRRFQIDAIDISERLLGVARKGIYGSNSFRGKDLGYRDRYFRPTAEKYQIAGTVRERVHFACGNLVSPACAPTAGSCDVIFCRNVLIYFAAETQQSVLRKLGQMLAPDGILIVGASEAFIARRTGFVSTARPRALRKEIAPATLQLPALPRPAIQPVRAVQTGPALKAPGRAAEKSPPVSKRARKIGSANGLEAVERMANAGKLKEAIQACEAYVHDQAESPDGWCLLGILRDAVGDERRAAACYRKAIYLHPDHVEALVHLALIAEKAGDQETARRLQARAARGEDPRP